jgi:hypothetical protein
MDQVLQPYKTKGNIMVLYVLIFMFLDRRQEDDSELKWSIRWI